jgi:hypothetical protein
MRVIIISFLIIVCSALSGFSQDIALSRLKFDPFPDRSTGMVNQQLLKGPDGTIFVIWKSGLEVFVSQYVMETGRNLYFERVGTYDPDAWFFILQDNLFMITHTHDQAKNILEFKTKLFDERGKGSEFQLLTTVPYAETNDISWKKLRYFPKEKATGLVITVQDQQEDKHITGKSISIINIDASLHVKVRTQEVSLDKSFYMEEVKVDADGYVSGIIYLNVPHAGIGELAEEKSAYYVCFRKNGVLQAKLHAGYMQILSASYDIREGNIVVAGFARDGEDTRTLSVFLNTIDRFTGDTKNEQLDQLGEQYIKAVEKYMESGMKNKKRQASLFSVLDVSIYGTGEVSMLSCLKVKALASSETGDYEYFQNADIFLCWYNVKGRMAAFKGVDRAEDAGVVYHNFLKNPEGGGWIFYDGGFTVTTNAKDVSVDIVATIDAREIKKVAFTGVWDYKRYTWEHSTLKAFGKGLMIFGEEGWLTLEPLETELFAR